MGERESVYEENEMNKERREYNDISGSKEVEEKMKVMNDIEIKELE